MSLSAQEYKSLLTEVFQKQIIALGPAITLKKARKIQGLTIDDNGNVTDIKGVPQEIVNQLFEQFKELSDDIVKITMKPLLLRDQEAPVAEQKQEAKEAETETSQIANVKS